MGQFVVVEDRCHEAVVPAPLVPVELDCLAYTGSRKYPRIPHQCHFGHPPLSFRAQREILARKPRFLSRSLSHSFEAGSFEMTRGWIPSQTKRVVRTTRSHTHGVAVGYCIAPRRSGALGQPRVGHVIPADAGIQEGRRMPRPYTRTNPLSFAPRPALLHCASPTNMNGAQKNGWRYPAFFT
jgi:hypothetical protein